MDSAYLQVNFGSVRVERNSGAAVFVVNGQLLMFGGMTAGVRNVFQNKQRASTWLIPLQGGSWGTTSSRIMARWGCRL